MRIRRIYTPSTAATARHDPDTASIHIVDADETVVLRIDLDAQPAQLTWVRDLAFASLSLTSTLEDVVVLPATLDSEVDA